MSTNETPSPAPQQPPTQQSRLRRTVGGVGASLGCLALLVGILVAVAGVVAMFLDDPTFMIAAIALFVAVAAYQNTKRRK